MSGYQNVEWDRATSLQVCLLLSRNASKGVITPFRKELLRNFKEVTKRIRKMLLRLFIRKYYSFSNSDMIYFERYAWKNSQLKIFTIFFFCIFHHFSRFHSSAYLSTSTYCRKLLSNWLHVQCSYHWDTQNIMLRSLCCTF